MPKPFHDEIQQLSIKENELRLNSEISRHSSPVDFYKHL